MKKEFCGGKMSVSSVNDIPEGEYWVIVKNQSVTIPGDERSRTHPGHGYPEHTEHYLSMTVYETKKVMLAEMEKYEMTFGQRKEGRILFIRTPKVTTTVNVEVE